MPPRIHTALVALLVLAAPTVGAPAALAAQQGARVLDPQALLGQDVLVLPITMVVADASLRDDSLYGAWRDRATAVRRADSIIGEMLLGRAPEVQWRLAPEVRRIARRGTGFVGDPDRMGQAVMRAPNLSVVPGSLAAQLRNLVAMTDARRILIPAAVAFAADSTGALRADLSAVLVDARIGTVLWRTFTQGTGRTPEAALESALGTLFPPP